MKKNLTYKIIEKHLVSGEMKAGKEIAIKIDQTLTQDATGTMVYLQFEAIGIKRVQTELSVSYVDHNTIQTDYKNPDVFTAWQRHLPPGPSGAVRPPRKDTFRFRLPHTDRGRPWYACYRCRRP